MFVAAAGGRDHAPAHNFCRILYSPVDVKTCACSLVPWFDTALLIYHVCTCRIEFT